MKYLCFLFCFAICVSSLFSSCGGGGSGGSTSLAVTVSLSASLDGAKVETDNNDWPSGSTENQVVIVSFLLGAGTTAEDGTETGVVDDFVCLALNADTGLADMKTPIPSSYTYSPTYDRLTLHGVDVFANGDKVDVVMYAVVASSTSMTLTMVSSVSATDENNVKYEINLLDSSASLTLPNHVASEDSSDDDDMPAL